LPYWAQLESLEYLEHIESMAQGLKESRILSFSFCYHHESTLPFPAIIRTQVTT